jgi:arginyl-tRNA synthetase
MSDLKEQCRIFAAQAINALLPPGTAAIESGSLLLETPPDPAMGDVGIPLFPYAKVLRMGPPVIAAKVVALLQEHGAAARVGTFQAIGPYVNVKLDKGAATAGILGRILEEGPLYGRKNAEGKAPLAGRRVMVEFSSPNTNKPLHLGHLRNDALGESVSRILAAAGAEVYKVNIINNRGVHICKSMLAYQKFHAGDGAKATPEAAGVKQDRFVGDCYVEFDQYSKSPAGGVEGKKALEEAQALLVAWEKGDPAVHALWQKMNDWALSGIKATYARTGVTFDKLYFESETYMKGKDEVLRGLEAGVFAREADGSVTADLEEINLDKKKVLLRGDGTSIYITQDIGLAISRHDDWDFNQLVYVVGSEQQWHFKVLFYILKKLGYEWANRLFHLSYGMVNLPEGKMKSREGTVVDADDLINSLRDGALEEIAAKGREEAVGDPAGVAEKIAIGALHYFLLQVSPSKDMLFDPKESLAFNGNTGPYLQYMGARIASVMRKARNLTTEGTEDTEVVGAFCEAGSPASVARLGTVDFSLLTTPEEWELVKGLEKFPGVVEKAANELDPSVVATYLYEVAKSFGRFYHECPIVGVADAALSRARLCLAGCTQTVLRAGMGLILVPFLETM